VQLVSNRKMSFDDDSSASASTINKVRRRINATDNSTASDDNSTIDNVDSKKS
jgi:hypothetical protein